MRLALILFCSFLVCGFCYSQDQNKKTCSEKELTQFENFLAGNKTNFQKKVDELSATDLCASTVYAELVKLIDETSGDVTKKNDMCISAVGFCNNDQTVDKYATLGAVFVSDCLGKLFVVTRVECSVYFID